MTIITPTGGRPESFALCERWMSRQTRQPDQWVVIDDGVEPTPCTMGQTVIRLPNRPDEHTLARNLVHGLQGVTEADKVCVAEDDDWVAPHYLQTMSDRLDAHQMIGEANAFYYRMDLPGYRHMGNRRHASLASMGFTGHAIHMLRQICIGNIGKMFIDTTMWRIFRGPAMVHPQSGLVTQLKGGPGRPGLTPSHTSVKGWTPDPGHAELIRRIGQEDCRAITTSAEVRE